MRILEGYSPLITKHPDFAWTIAWQGHRLALSRISGHYKKNVPQSRSAELAFAKQREVSVLLLIKKPNTNNSPHRLCPHRRLGQYGPSPVLRQTFHTWNGRYAYDAAELLVPYSRLRKDAITPANILNGSASGWRGRALGTGSHNRWAKIRVQKYKRDREQVCLF